MWVCSKCQADVDDNFDACWKCQTDREGQGGQPFAHPVDEFPQEPSNHQDAELNVTWLLPLGYGIIGALCGATIGYLVGPTLPLVGGHLPLSTVLSAGGDLQGLDAALLTNMAKEAFNTFLISTIFGGAVGFGFGKLKQSRQHASRSPQSNKQITVLSPGAVLVTEEAPFASPACIELGQTVEEVQNALKEQPRTIIRLGGKQVHVHTDMKITFIDGRVTDVQT